MKTDKRTKKSPEQLREGYYIKVEHSVQRFDTWLSKLLKATKSKKYQLTAGQKASILDHATKTFEQFKVAMESQKPEESFKLDK